MLREWTDELEPSKEAEVWLSMAKERILAEVARLETELKSALSTRTVTPRSFFAAMRHFLVLRDTLFPDLPGEPALKLLMTLAETPKGRGQASVTGIAYGAGVPLATAIRYLAIMEAQGIVERRPDPQDGRRYLIDLTAEGHRRIDELAGHWSLRVLIALVAPAALLLYSLW